MRWGKPFLLTAVICRHFQTQDQALEIVPVSKPFRISGVDSLAQLDQTRSKLRALVKPPSSVWNEIRFHIKGS